MKNEKELMFDKYVKMIQKKAWEVSKNTGYDYEDIEAEGFKLYCEALKTWNPDKSSFSTHLHNYLMQLSCYPLWVAPGYQRGREVGELSETAEKKLESKYNSIQLYDILDCAKEILTSTSYNIIKWILERSWESDSVHKPNISMCCRMLNLQRKEVEVAWAEIKNFWKNEGTLLFA